MNKNEKIGKAYRGRVKRNPDGFGFFISETSEIEDIYIPKEAMYGVFSNDLVEVTVNRRAGKFGTRGKIKKIIERASNRFVGKLLLDKKSNRFYLNDTSHTWGMKLFVKNEEKFLVGELVLVEVNKFPKLGKTEGLEGEVVSGLGRSVDPNTDNIRILHESKVPVEFTDKALKEARSHGDTVLEKDKKGRVDLRKTPLITIDGVTAKDFDDAVYVEKTRSGFKLIVAIADVSHYVKAGSKLDQEAYDKGTSVYLSNYVCPMLPEELSNGLCSLNPNVDRLCFCCEMNFSHSGDIENFKFFEGVMNSHARVTYGEAQNYLESGKSDLDKKVLENITNASELSETLNKHRMKGGSVDFDLPAIKVLVDDTGEATDLIKEERIFSHRLIEELMLATNICASKFLEGKKIPQLFRVHESPEAEDLQMLQRQLTSFLGQNVGKIKTSYDFQKVSKLLADLDQNTLKNIAQGFTLRSMKQAQYSSENQGHFGLSFSHYAHFTSPIRRYPDLVIHRQIKSALGIGYKAYPDTDVDRMGNLLSAAEQRAVKAERKVTSIKKARFFEKHVGEEFEGYISSLVKFGAFVTLRTFPLDGLIKLDELSGDHFEYDEENWILKGKRTGKIFRAGDQVVIKVLNVDVEDGKIDFGLVSHEGKKAPEKKFFEKIFKSKPSKKGKSKNKKSSKKNRGKKSKSDLDDSKDKNVKKEKSRKDEKPSSKKKAKKSASSMFSSSSSSRGLTFSKKGQKKKRKK